MSKNNTEQVMAVFTNLSCKILFPFLIAFTANINKTAVIPLMVAYIGGKNDNGFTSIQKSESLTLNKAATATGIIIDKITIHLLYFFSINSGVLILFV